MHIDYYEQDPGDCTFYSIVVDITHRCNMNCKNCYIPNRTLPDMEMQPLIKCLEKIPNRSEIRLMGAEPTLHPDLEKIITEVRRIGHRPIIVTNGLKLANKEYAQKLYDAGLRTVNISLNGADDDEIYLKTDNKACSELKIQALKNCVEIGYFINTNTIIIKGMNEHVPVRIYEILKNLNVSKGVMRFRNVAQLGRHMVSHDQNLTYNELVNVICTQFKKSPDEAIKYNTINGFEEKNTILFPINEEDERQSLFVKITNWSHDENSIPDPNSKRRGRVTKDFKIAPFFEHVKTNEFNY